MVTLVAPPRPGLSHRQLVGRGLLATAGVALVLSWSAPTLVAASTSWFRLGLRLLAPEFQVIGLSIQADGARRRLTAEFTLARPVSVGRQTLQPDPRGRAQSAVPVHHAVLMPAALAIVLLTWPCTSRREVARRLALAAPALALLTLADMPAALAAGPWNLLMDHHDPLGRRWIQVWAGLLDHGLRPMAGVLAGLAILALTRPTKVIAAGPSPPSRAIPDGPRPA